MTGLLSQQMSGSQALGERRVHIDMDYSGRMTCHFNVSFKIKNKKWGGLFYICSPKDRLKNAVVLEEESSSGFADTKGM